MNAPARLPVKTYAESDDGLSLAIEGMTCATCVGRVERAIAGAPGVARVSVNLATERANVEFADGRYDVGAVADAVLSAGYTPVTQTTELTITGMTCGSCVGRVEKALLKVPGVRSASVNLATETARIEAVGNVPAYVLVDAVESAGYTASARTGSAEAERDAEDGRRDTAATGGRADAAGAVRH